jgi:hypothetical protein
MTEDNKFTQSEREPSPSRTQQLDIPSAPQPPPQPSSTNCDTNNKVSTTTSTTTKYDYDAGAIITTTTITTTSCYNTTIVTITAITKTITQLIPPELNPSQKPNNAIIKDTPSNVSKVAVLIENRIHHNLVPVILNFIKNLPSDFLFQIFHTEHNREYILKSAVGPYINSGKVIMDPSLLANFSIKSIADYNYLITRESTWQKFLGEKVLLYQLDSVSCGNFTGDFNEFLKYDYLGAPWPYVLFPLLLLTMIELNVAL